MKDTYTDHQEITATPNPVDADRARQAQTGYGAMAIAASMAGGYREDGKQGPIVTAAKLFCILFAFLAPSLLLIDVALN